MATLKTDQALLWIGSDAPINGTWVMNSTSYGDRREAQGFTPSVSGNLDSISLSIVKSSTSVGDLTVAVYATAAGKPTGSALASQVVSQASIPSSSTPAVRVNIAFSSPAALTSGTVYAIVLSSAFTGSNNYTYSWYGSLALFYAGGNASYTINGGSTWNMSTGNVKFSLVTHMSVPVATPGKDQFTFGAQHGSTPAYQVNTAGAYRAQTFKPSVSGYFHHAWLHIGRADGQTTGTVDFKVYAVDINGKPTGSPLASQTIADTALPGNVTVPWVTVTFSSPALLTAGTYYAFVEQFNNVDSTHKYNLGTTYYNNQYANGQRWDSADYGSTWASNLNAMDLLFLTAMTEPVTVTQTVSSDAVIQATAETTIVSDAFCGEETTKTISSDSLVIIVTTETIDSDAFCGEETTKAILGNASIGTTEIKTVNSDAFCGEETLRTIVSDSTVLVTEQVSITADAKVNLVSTRTITALAAIRATFYKTICAQASVAVVVTQTVSSDASVYKPEPVIKLYVVA